MTGRDFIIYLLENGLEDKPIYSDGRLLGFVTLMEAAAKFGVGAETVRAWCDLGVLPYIYIEGRYFIPALAKPTLKGGSDV